MKRNESPRPPEKISVEADDRQVEVVIGAPAARVRTERRRSVKRDRDDDGVISTGNKVF